MISTSNPLSISKLEQRGFSLAHLRDAAALGGVAAEVSLGKDPQGSIVSAVSVQTRKDG
jgi:hypothetical protein